MGTDSQGGCLSSVPRQVRQRSSVSGIHFLQLVEPSRAVSPLCGVVISWSHKGNSSKGGDRELGRQRRSVCTGNAATHRAGADASLDADAVE